MSRLATALRIARRDAARAKGRSALVIAMIALPVTGVGAADVIYRTFQLTPDQKATRAMGAADAVVADTGSRVIHQQSALDLAYDDVGPRQGPPPPLASVLPAGARIIPDAYGAAGTASAGDRTVTMQQRFLAYTDPLAKGIFRVDAGGPPRAGREVTLTSHLAHRLHVALGDVVTLRAGHTTSSVTVVGLVTEYGVPAGDTVLRDPSTAPNGPGGVRYLVDAPRALTWSDVQRANASGFALQTRGHVAGEPPVPSLGGTALPKASTLTAIGLVVGMVLLEIVLLAGPAFAVSAKRQSRDLALLAATGAERSQVRNVVLGAGAVLGAVGGVLGVVLGIAAARIAVPRLGGALPGPFELRPLELLGITAVGLVTAVLAALLPSHQASRQDVVAALTGRRGQVRSRPHVPILGAAMAAIGMVIALEGATRRSVNTILAGSALAELGLVTTTPYLVGFFGRLSPYLPVGPRLALRDAARNRSRTAPAVSAILAAVAGSVAVGCYLVSLDRYHERNYTPSAAYGTTFIPLDHPGPAVVTRMVAALRAALPGARTVVAVRGMQLQGGDGDNPPWPQLASCTPQPLAPCEVIGAGPQVLGAPQTPFPVVMTGGVDELAAVLGHDASRYAPTLDQGGAVVPFATATNGTVALTSKPPTPKAAPGHVVVPAVSVRADEPQVLFLTPAAAAKLGAPVSTIGIIAPASVPPTKAQEDRARGALAGIDPDIGFALQVERGYQANDGLGLLALVVGSAIIVLGASGIATGLAAADGRADLATLAAVGASPGRRRSLAAFQSAVTAGLGTVLGTIAGLVPAAGMVRALNQQLRHDRTIARPYPFVVPWHNLAVTVILVPLLAAGAAALLTRSRLPMLRRVG